MFVLVKERFPVVSFVTSSSTVGLSFMYAKATNGIKQVKHEFTINRYLYMNMQNLSAGGKSFDTLGSFLVYEQSGFGCMQVKSLHGGHKRLSIWWTVISRPLIIIWWCLMQVFVIYMNKQQWFSWFPEKSHCDCILCFFAVFLTSGGCFLA